MPKPKVRFYAVRRGREGPKIYTTWAECEKSVKGWPAARHKSFLTLQDAQEWLDGVQEIVNNAWSTVPKFEHEEPRTPSPLTPPPIPLDDVPFTADYIPLPSPSQSPLRDGNGSISGQQSSETITLSSEQEHILNLVKEGQNVFFTGSAGTGKSVLLREIIKHCGGSISDQLAITASTGIAAVNIGGVTLHSWAGVGLGVEKVEVLVQKIQKNKGSLKRWRRVKTLIIDEISMVDGALYDKLEEIARELRDYTKPFGGIQLVLSGDFCQLPPVKGRDLPDITFAFEANSWRHCFDTNVNTGSVYTLTKVFRQRDQDFINMLNALRHGKPDNQTCVQFRRLRREIKYSDGLEPCELFPTRDQVLKANETRLARLTGDIRTFQAMDIGGKDQLFRPVNEYQARELLNKLVIAPEILQLKVGAQVMLIKNTVQGRLVNGSMGQIMAFQSVGEARSNHTEIAEVDKTKEIGKRPRSRSDAEEEMDHNYGLREWPVVRFSNGQELLLTPADFEVVNSHGKMEARRDQVPLILSWALSIHKSQGQTLERVKVDLGRIFETGQAYVALSRATNLEGLQVLNFEPSKVMAHPRVLDFYAKMRSALPQSTASSTPPRTPPSAQHTDERDEYDEYDEMDDEEAMSAYYAAQLDGF